MAAIRYVQRVKRANGRLDLYFRKGDHHEGPLLSVDDSDELRAEVDAILTRLAARPAPAKPRPGTVGGLLAAYAGSDEPRVTACAEFTSLAASTQKEYRRLADEMREDIGDVLLADVTPAWLRELRDAWALRGHRAANVRRQVLENAMAGAIEDQDIEGDPFARLKKVKRPHDAGEAHPIWEEAEVLAAIEGAIARKRPGLARAIALGRYGGFRRGTICVIPLNARVTGFDDRGVPHARLQFITAKRKVLADKPEEPRLTAVLARTPDKALTIAYNADGYAWKPRQLNQALDRLLIVLAKAGKVRKVVDGEGRVSCPLTIHGLRHARGVELAMAGASDAEIMAQLEHATDRAAKIYRRQADRRKLADQGQARVDGVIKLRVAAKHAKPSCR